MGWSKKDVFDDVALTVEAQVDMGRLDEPTGQRIMESLINSLTNAGWDDLDIAMRENEKTPFIIQAFENCGHKIIE